MLRLQVRIVLKNFALSHRRTEFAEDVFDSQSRPLEHGFTEHHILAFLNVILPHQCHDHGPVRVRLARTIVVSSAMTVLLSFPKSRLVQYSTIDSCSRCSAY